MKEMRNIKIGNPKYRFTANAKDGEMKIDLFIETPQSVINYLAIYNLSSWDELFSYLIANSSYSRQFNMAGASNIFNNLPEESRFAIIKDMEFKKNNECKNH